MLRLCEHFFWPKSLEYVPGQSSSYFMAFKGACASKIDSNNCKYLHKINIPPLEILYDRRRREMFSRSHSNTIMQQYPFHALPSSMECTVAFQRLHKQLQ